MNDRTSDYSLTRRRIFKRVGRAALFEVSHGAADVGIMVIVRCLFYGIFFQVRARK